MALLFADKKMAELARQREGLDVLFNQVPRSLLPLKLLTVAVAVRGALDSIANNDPSQYNSERCGSYVSGIKNEGATDLSLRRACDCAIHATRTLFYSGEGSVAENCGVFNGKIALYGLHRDRKQPEWNAEIDLEKFALESLAALDALDALE